MPKTFHHIPQQRPSTDLLDSLPNPAALRALQKDQLEQVVDELREYLLWSVGQSGGHFGAGLGVIELTVALHYLYQTPYDRLVWDVGHQCYPHKILTGRRDQLPTIRQQGGLSGFPKRSESEYDTFGVGHSSTSISAALGMALGSEMAGTNRRSVAIIGDGAMTAGQAFEALNHAAHTKANLLVVLNDNNMSISHNVGGLANYFARVWSSKSYIRLREGGKKVLASMPAAWDFVRRTEESMKNMVSPDALFESIGFNYIGPMDGHDLDELISTLENLRDLEGPQFLHIYTTKGKGFEPAEHDPVGYHALNKIEPKKTSAVPAKPKTPKYQDVFGSWLCDMALADNRLVAITPAMCEGSGMVAFSKQFPQRFHDVAICEQHAVTLAAGLACEDQKPIVAIYSTFLQRGYDQLVHDVVLQDLDVTFAIDRAGLVGEDGATHGGVFDLAFMRCLPNIIIAAPSNEDECRKLLTSCYRHEGTAAVRYPRGTGPGTHIEMTLETLPVGEARVVREGNSGIAILSFGVLLPAAETAASDLDATVVDMRWVKPLDEALLTSLATSHHLFVTLEDHQRMGGAGSAVNEFVAEKQLTVQTLNLGLPDHFIHHGKRDVLLAQVGLDSDGILQRVQQATATTRTDT